MIRTISKFTVPCFCVPPGPSPHCSSRAVMQSVLQGSWWTPAVCSPCVVIIVAPLLGPQQVMDGVRLKPCSRRLGRSPTAVPLLRWSQTSAQGWMDVLLSQHNVTLADRAGLSAGATVLLMLFSLIGGQLQITELTRDQSMTAF